MGDVPSLDEVRPLRRYRELDALRGVAAVLVLASHVVRFVNNDGVTGLFATPFSPDVLGQGSVVLFFVLSGFVLSQPYLAGHSQPYAAFAVRRLVRLYVPVAVTITLSLLGLWLFGSRVAGVVPKAIAFSWETPASREEILRHYLLAGWPRLCFRLDPPMWSLVIEIRASLLFPLLLIATRRMGLWGLIIAAMMTLVGSKLEGTFNNGDGIQGFTPFGSLLLTLRYLGFFVIGIVLAMRLDVARRITAALPPWLHAVLVAIILSVCWTIALQAKVNSGLVDLFYGAVAVYLICLVLAESALCRLLCHRLPLWLGAISFSLYIVHWPVLVASYALLGPLMPSAVMLPVGVAMAFAVATVAERFVERPSHEWSKRISRMLDPRRSRARVPAHEAGTAR